MRRIGRKALLDRLSSPEQLDKMIVITPPSFWIALLGAVFIIVSALIWSVFGRLPVNVNTQGIYVNQEGTLTVYSDTTGVVSEVLVEEGSWVEKGDVIANLNTEEIDEKIKDYEKRIKEVEAITMDSTDDVVTSDNKNLVEVKNQMITVEQTLQQDQALLELRTQELADKKQQAAKSEENFLAAETAYFKSLYIGNDVAEQLRYTETQSALSNASSYLESANSKLSQAQLTYLQSEAEYNYTNNAYKAFLAEKSAIDENFNQKITELERVLRENGIDTSNLTLEVIRNLDFNSFAAEIKETLERARTEYLTAYYAMQDFYEKNAGKEEKYKEALETQKLSLHGAEVNRDSAQSTVNTYTQQRDAANSGYESAKSAYIVKSQTVALEQQKQSELGNKYNQALNQYNTDKNAVTSLEDTVMQLEAQVKVDQKNVDNQIEVIYSQFHATKASVLSQLKTEYEEYCKKKKQAQIKAIETGTIYDLGISIGNVINRGGEVARLQPGDGDDRVIVCYVPVQSGKKVQEGMKALIYPSTVNKQEYGHMEAEVTNVAPYITSMEDIQKQLGNDKLVEVFLKDGPVVEVTCTLRTSDKTASGYYWSSNKGSNIQIKTGTMVEADIVVEEKAPITMLIPYIKEKLTVKAED